MSSSPDYAKTFGLYITPEWVIKLMIDLINKDVFQKEKVLILEPACDTMPFITAIRDRFNLPNLDFYAVEIRDVVGLFPDIFNSKKVNLWIGDYLLWDTDLKFDIIIGNPPYGIPSPSEHYPIRVTNSVKREYKKRYKTWYGKYNLYGAFIEKSVELLAPDGQLLFIVPATFMVLDEFCKLREYLANEGKTNIIYLGNKVFKPAAKTTVVILNFSKSPHIRNNLSLYEYKNGEILPVMQHQAWRGEVIKFESSYTRWLENVCGYKIKDFYNVHISPRTTEISRNPLVKTGINPCRPCLPILNSRNLKAFEIKYDDNAKYWIEAELVRSLRKFFGTPHIVVGLGFREKRSLVAAIDKEGYPWYGDVYHLVRKDKTTSQPDIVDFTTVEYLNSQYAKKYIEETYRDIVYHLNKKLLEDLPLPTFEVWEKLKAKDILDNHRF